MKLRPRQQQFVDRCVAALQEYGNTLGVAPTGAGKTLMLSSVIEEWLRSDKDGAIQGKACVLAHRDELTRQNEDKFQRITQGLSTSVVNASQKSWKGDVTFAMVQTLARQSNLLTMPALDLLVIDEAHHVAAPSYQRIIQQAKAHHPAMAVLGVTATPKRGDKQGLQSVFSNVADQIRLGEMIHEGYLVKPRTFVIDVGATDDLKKVKKTVDDFDMHEVEKIMDKQVIHHEVIQHWQKVAGDRQTIVFASTVKHAQHVCQAFCHAGIKADVIHGELPTAERCAHLDAFDNGELQVLINCFVLSEGFDSQPVSCVVLLRPSSYHSTYTQMVGRGLRTVDPVLYPDVMKSDCIVLDFGTSTLLHGSLEQEADLVGETSVDSSAREKACPSCQVLVAASCKQCPLCDYVWKPKPVEPKKTLLDNIAMTEVDLFTQSAFRWCDLFHDQASWMATGMQAWAGVFLLNGHWYSVGGTQSIQAQLLAHSRHAVCLAAADGWLQRYESPKGARKSNQWHEQTATTQQLRFLPLHYRKQFGLTRYHASCLLAFQFNKKLIQRAIAQGNHGMAVKTAKDGYRKEVA